MACIVGGQLIERSKDALDDIYVKGTDELERILNALEVYGVDTVVDEVKYCLDELLKVCAAEQDVKLRELIFTKTNTNAFPSVFAVILIAFHEIIIGECKKVADYEGIKGALNNLSTRIETGRKATGAEERRKNIDAVKGNTVAHFVEDKKLAKVIYSNHTTIDIESSRWSAPRSS